MDNTLWLTINGMQKDEEKLISIDIDGTDNESIIETINLFLEKGREEGFVEGLRILLLKYWYEPVLSEVAIESGMFSHFQRNVICVQDIYSACLSEEKRKMLISMIKLLLSQNNYIFFVFSTDEQQKNVEKEFLETAFPNMKKIQI